MEKKSYGVEYSVLVPIFWENIYIIHTKVKKNLEKVQNINL